MAVPGPAAVRLNKISHHYGEILALDGISLEIPAGKMVGVIGPDGAGKSTLLSLVAGAKALQEGLAEVLGGDMTSSSHRKSACPRIAFMPQGLGRNLYPTLTVKENLEFFARLFGDTAEERHQRILTLTRSTGLEPFLHRPAGKLSGGMRQKLGLCCALIHNPDLLILDEPTTGVDPLARSQFWKLIASIRKNRPTMSVLVATAYMDEARNFDWLIAMDAGKLLATGTPVEILKQTQSTSLEAAFVTLTSSKPKVSIGQTKATAKSLSDDDIAIEARGLTLRFGDFTAVDHVDFKIRRGEIFGFLGSNGCGKTTTMKMLTGLLPLSEGSVVLFGKQVDAADINMRRRIGYMSQSFSLYGELTVKQNLVLHARLFQVPVEILETRVVETAHRFGLEELMGALPGDLPLGIRQRLSLAVAMVHRPELLILDEPTSGVDPSTRDRFWDLMIELSRQDRITIFISTHMMNEAERCDRVSLMHAGKVLESGSPAEIITRHESDSLEAAFIDCLSKADPTKAVSDETLTGEQFATKTTKPRSAWQLSLTRTSTYIWRESLELTRDPLRATLALIGSIILLCVMGFGINIDVENIRYAVLDRDQTALSRDYALNLSGSRYFSQQPPLKDYAELDRRMRSGEIALAIEIPAGFSRDRARGNAAEIGAWVDGAMPTRAETTLGYIQGMHEQWVAAQALNHNPTAPPPLYKLETRFRYNPDVLSLPAMVPAVIPLLLLMLPAMLTALAVVREKELGSIVNLYVTPTSPAEFMLGKQLPYVGLAMINFLLMCGVAIFAFGIPLTGSFLTLVLAAMLFSFVATGMGLLASTLTRSQIAAIFFTMVGTMVPAYQFAGMMTPVASLQGVGKVIGDIHPLSHMLTISRGVFNKALGFADLKAEFWPLALSVPVIIGLAILLLRKQED